MRTIRNLALTLALAAAAATTLSSCGDAEYRKAYRDAVAEAWANESPDETAKPAQK
jgi:hypothetical protein